MTDGTERRPASPPSSLYTFLEQRAVGEVGAFMAASPFLRLFGRGDRHPVLVLPGFRASDRSTEALRWYLRSLGYWTHGWQLGQNVGPAAHVVRGISHRLAELHDRHGRRVSLVGQSLGGIYARHLARHHPEMVRSVITLGSPFRSRPEDRSAVDALWRRAVAGSRAEVARLLADGAAMELTVPSTAIYSRTDGIVRWYLCLETTGPLRESIEVRSSHTGMGFNPSVLYVVADRLAQGEGSWRPFRPPPTMRHLYPRPASYRPAA
jgi:pimeloyl-ACP methyl ester carboxylesterase